MDWSDYLAIPKKPGGRDREGVDCWGLICLIYRERFGIELPLYEGVDWTKGNEVWAAIAEEEALEWVTITRSAIKEGDVVVLNIRGVPWHVGMMISPYQFIHTDPALGVSLARLDSIHWRNRVVSFQRLNGNDR